MLIQLEVASRIKRESIGREGRSKLHLPLELADLLRLRFPVRRFRGLLGWQCPAWDRCRVGRPFALFPVFFGLDLSDGVLAGPTRRSALRNRTRPPCHEIGPPSRSALTFSRVTAGRLNGSRVSSVMRRGASAAWEEGSFDSEFLPNHNYLRGARQLNIRPGVNKAGYR